MTVIETTEGSLYHPQFNSSDADIVLVSTENTLYRVPSFALRNISQNIFTSKSHVRVITDEKDAALSKVLYLMCGLLTGRWESIDQLEDTLEIAHKWEALGPLSVIRNSITAPQFLADPLLYAIATRFEWDEEAKLASIHTQSLNLYDDEHGAKLERLLSKHLMALLLLHRHY